MLEAALSAAEAVVRHSHALDMSLLTQRLDQGLQLEAETQSNALSVQVNQEAANRTAILSRLTASQAALEAGLTRGVEVVRSALAEQHADHVAHTKQVLRPSPLTDLVTEARADQHDHHMAQANVV